MKMLPEVNKLRQGDVVRDSVHGYAYAEVIPDQRHGGEIGPTVLIRYLHNGKAIDTDLSREQFIGSGRFIPYVFDEETVEA